MGSGERECECCGKTMPSETVGLCSRCVALGCADDFLLPAVRATPGDEE